MINPIAASLALPDTDRTLAALDVLAPQIGRAEIRLDLMEQFDLPRLIAAAPCPLIMTCRPQREGGRFAGSETQRLAILQAAIAAGAAFIDLEWDSLAALPAAQRGTTKVIASRHWFDRMPADLLDVYRELRQQADVIKLVGTATSLADVLPILALLHGATTPVIGIAMGQAGRLTRILAPCFPAALLTFGAPSPAEATAPGQLSVGEMAEQYGLDQVGPHTAIHLHLYQEDQALVQVQALQAAAQPGHTLHLAIQAASSAVLVAEQLRTYLPHLAVHVME